METMDKLYTDFTTHIAPKIAEGLVITKEYFGELFGRYIKYLIVTDIIALVLDIIILVVSVLIIIKLIKVWKGMERWDDAEIFVVFGFIFAGVFATVAVFSIYYDTQNLVKTIYIPEVRIVEELRGFNSK